MCTQKARTHGLVLLFSPGCHPSRREFVLKGRVKKDRETSRPSTTLATREVGLDPQRNLITVWVWPDQSWEGWDGPFTLRLEEV